MAKSRIVFQSILESIADNVYYQPPKNVTMNYPCIVYNLSDIDSTNANNSKYMLTKGYMVTVIDRNPESTVPEELLLTFPMSSFQSNFIQDNLNHWVIQIYY